AVRVESDLVAQGKLAVRLAFPRGHDLAVKNTPALDWSLPEAHASVLTSSPTSGTQIARSIGTTHYTVAINGASVTETARHHFQLVPVRPMRVFAFTVTFAPPERTLRPTPIEAIFAASAQHWEKFWKESAAVDFT